MFRRRWVAVAATFGMTAAIMGLMIVEVTNASSRAPLHEPPVVGPSFRYVVDASWIWTGTRYALAGSAFSAKESSVALIDNQTGRRKTITRAGCDPVEPSVLEPLDLAWVPFNCSPALTYTPPAPELYSPATRQWRAVSPSPRITHPCGDAPCDVYYYLAAAGQILA
jgi:hypothetical protein